MPITGGRQETTGCYQLSFGPWSSGSSVPDRILSHTTLALPRLVHLHATGDVSPRWAAFEDERTLLSGHLALFRTDSLVVQWADQTLTLRLRPSGDSLAGTAKLGFSEAEGASWPTATVAARQVRCP